MTRRKSTEWLQTIHKNVSDLYIINNLFWQFQRVLQENERLTTTNNVFFDWINALFSESIVMRVRREVDTGEDCISALEFLRRLRASPDVLARRITDAELEADIEALSRRRTDITDAAPATVVRAYADRRVAHADPRRLQDGPPTFRQVNECITHLCALLNKYVAVCSDHALPVLPPACGTNWMEIFTFPWIEQ